MGGAAKGSVEAVAVSWDEEAGVQRGRRYLALEGERRGRGKCEGVG